MIIVTGQAHFADGEIERLRPQLIQWVERVRQRDGCLSYDYAIDMIDRNCVHVVHHWRDEAALNAHIEDMGILMEALAGARMPFLSVKAYEASYLKTLLGE